MSSVVYDRARPLCKQDEELERLHAKVKQLRELLRRALPWIGKQPISLTLAEHDVAEITRDVRATVEEE